MPVYGCDPGYACTCIWLMVLCVCVHDVWRMSTLVLSPWLPGQVSKCVLPPNGILKKGLLCVCVFVCVCTCT